MRRFAMLLPLALLAAACAAETVTPLTTTPVRVEEPSTTTTTVVEATTTTVGGSVDICQPRTVIWESGTTYSASCFLLPWSMVSPGDGWRAPGVDDDSILVSWIDPIDPNKRVNVALIIPNENRPDWLEWIVSIDGLDELGSGSTAVAGRNAMWIDVEGRDLNPLSESRGCAQDTGGVLFKGGSGNGYWIAPAPGDSSPPDSLGVGACDVARIWVMEVTNRKVIVIGGTDDPDRHDEAVAKIEELFEGMSFDVGAGS